MAFESILFPHTVDRAEIDRCQQPAFFGDLNLDQIVASITAGRDEYQLRPFFYWPLGDQESIECRHDVFHELEQPDLITAVRAFAQGMRTMRAHLQQALKLHHPYQRQRWFLDAVDAYAIGVGGLRDHLVGLDLRTLPFTGLRDYVATYAAAPPFMSLVSETDQLKADLASVAYRVLIHGDQVRVNRYEAESDYSAEVEKVFEKFEQGPTTDYQFGQTHYLDMNHVEAAILDRVALLYADVFASLTGYYTRHRAYLDETIGRFDREIQFYLACLEHVDRFKSTGLSFCRPEITAESKEVFGDGVFDLSLAEKLLDDGGTVITNEFHLDDPERIIVVSGPNQGGKTTFARTFGQLHYLARLGCPVPASRARLFLFDQLFTHFEREEDLEDLSGKLESDLLRIHDILERATSRSVLIMNESFSSTTLDDAVFLNRQVLGRVIELDLLCVAVTFLDELASIGPTTVSMVSTVDPDDPVVRTFRIVRRPADGLAYALVLARKYGLTFERVRERVAS